MVNLPAEKIDQLKVFLSALPDQMTTKLRLVAKDADPELAELLSVCLGETDRKAYRAFFAPLAPITGTKGVEPPSQSYAKSVLLEAIWRWLDESLAPGIAAEISELISQSKDKSGACLDEVRLRVADLLDGQIEHAHEDERHNKKIRVQLELDELESLEHVSSFLRAAPIIRKVLKGLPQSIREIDEELSTVICDTYKRAAERDADAGVWVLIIIMGRLEKPWQLFRAFERITRREDDLLASQTDMSHVGDALLRDAEFYLGGFSSSPIDEDSAKFSANALAKFSAITVGMTREIGVRKDGAWGKRLFALREQASNSMTRIHMEARTMIESAVPEAASQRKRRHGQKPDQDRAEAFALFLNLSKNDAARAAVGSAHNTLISDMIEACQSAGESILAGVRNGAEKDPEHSEARIRQIGSLLTAFGHGEDGEILVRRTLAARAA